MKKFDYDIAVIGGGVAGLAAANLLSANGLKTVVFEKHKYPFHKVCGEYVSLESGEFLRLLNFDYKYHRLPIINKFKLTAGKSFFETKLPLGGIGVSRYFLDNHLMKTAKGIGAEILEGIQVNKIIFNHDHFEIKTSSGDLTANVAIGAFGKRSNLDISPPEKSKQNNYIAVKYHINANLPADQIELHIFKNGYCGISKVEGENKYCLCYMTTAENLKNSQNDIEKLEQTILSENIWLRKYFNSYEKIFDKPITISQIKLGMKAPVFNKMIMAGDAAGSVAPLCGNGISTAFHCAYIASELIIKYFNDNLSYDNVLENYKSQWRHNFYNRIRAGLYLQKLFLNKDAAEIAIKLLKQIPSVHSPLIKLTHGKNFVKTQRAGIPVR